jgi:hypothetical protein
MRSIPERRRNRSTHLSTNNPRRLTSHFNGNQDAAMRLSGEWKESDA